MVILRLSNCVKMTPPVRGNCRLCKNDHLSQTLYHFDIGLAKLLPANAIQTASLHSQWQNLYVHGAHFRADLAKRNRLLGKKAC